VAGVHVAGDGPVAVVTIDNPPLNLLTTALRQRLAHVATDLGRRSDVRAVVLTGAGDRAFSAGSDIGEFPRDPAAGMRRVRANHDVYHRLQRIPQPVVAALCGHVLGGGLELALTCDLRVADETATFGMPEIGVGVFPAAGGTQRLPRVVGAARAKEMMMVGEPIDAEEALRVGLVNRVVPAGQALDAALALARTIAERPGLAVRAIKRAVDGGLEEGPERGEELERELIATLFGSFDVREGLAAFRERRRPRFEHR
jgi:enoyl-CoA hydratase/carnithine racemase